MWMLADPKGGEGKLEMVGKVGTAPMDEGCAGGKVVAAVGWALEASKVGDKTLALSWNSPVEGSARLCLGLLPPGGGVGWRPSRIALMMSAARHLAYLIFSSISASISPNTLSSSRKLAAATKFLAVFL